jgi:hypothetical protein
MPSAELYGQVRTKEKRKKMSEEKKEVVKKEKVQKPKPAPKPYVDIR